VLADYQSHVFQANGVSLQLNQLDATPFMATYVYPKPNTAYFHNDFKAKSIPAYLNSDAAAYLNKTNGVCSIPPANASFISNISDNATGQVPWLKSCLSTSNATWSVVNGHYGLWGSDVQFADPRDPTGKAKYPGQCGAWASVADLINQYKVPVYLNGHDHTMTHADPAHVGVASGATNAYGNATYYVSPPSPQYFTLGNGGVIQYGDGVTLDAPKAYNNFSTVVYNDNVDGAPGEGFAILTATACNITVHPPHAHAYHECNLALPDQHTHTKYAAIPTQ
jgi:hypothetical protein